MSPSRLRSWLHKRKATAVQLRLSAERLAGAPQVVRVWDVDELEQHSDVAAMVLDVAEEFANERRQTESCVLEWLDASGRVVATTTHRAVPTAEEDLGAAALNADRGSSAHAIVQHLLQHDAAKEKILIGSLGVIFGASERAQNATLQVLEHQQRRIAGLEAENLVLRQQLQAARTDSAEERELSEEERAESLAKAEAWGKFSQLAPDVLELIIAHARRLGGGAGGNAQ